jgi:hypothetical protein
MVYRLLADLVVAVHFAYVAFVVVGLVFVLVGLWRGWRWVRNPWFRVVHLVAILIVALESVLNIACPLTTWEQELRAAAGDEVSRGTFIGDLLHRLLFVQAPPWAFTVAYVAFAGLVLVTFVLAPPRRRTKPAVNDLRRTDSRLTR